MLLVIVTMSLLLKVVLFLTGYDNVFAASEGDSCTPDSDRQYSVKPTTCVFDETVPGSLQGGAPQTGKDSS